MSKIKYGKYKVKNKEFGTERIVEIKGNYVISGRNKFLIEEFLSKHLLIQYLG